MADVAVVVGNYEGATVLPDCLESLANQTVPPTELIVVDASSSDASSAVARAAGAQVIVMPNLGLGALYNRGVGLCRSPLVLLLNNDVALDSHCLGALAASLEEDASRFAADPMQLDWAAAKTIHARTILTRGRLLREYVPGLHLDHLVDADEVTPTVCANGAAMLVRRSMFVDLGGFDETFFMEWEDLDLCWRAWGRGWPSVYVPHARVRHRVGAVTGEAEAPRREASSHHNLIRFALKCLPWPETLRLVGGEILRLPRYPEPIVRALARVMTESPEILAARRALPQKRQLFERVTAFV
jgi:GT2 family glycosyltransferase